MSVDSETVAVSMLRLMDLISKYKVYHMDKNFKLNGSSPGELSQRQFHILGLVEYLKVDSITEISLVTHQSSSSCSLVVSKLEEGGYLVKRYAEQQGDKRKMQIFLTDQGKLVLKKIRDDMVSEIERFLSSYNHHQQEVFIQGCRQLMSLFPDDRFAPFDQRELDRGFGEEILQGILSTASWIKRNYANDCHVHRNKQELLHPGQLAVIVALSTGCQLQGSWDDEIFGGEHTVSQLAAYLNLSESTVSITLSKLTDLGYVDRRRPAKGEDGRRIYFSLTPSGEQVLRASYQNLLNTFQSYCESLTEEKQETLYQGVSKLYQILEQRQDIVIN